VSRVYLLDTGPLVSLVRRRDDYHAWAASLVGSLTPPLLTCEPVIAEACYLVRELKDGGCTVLDLVAQGVLRIDFSIMEDIESLKTAMRKYEDIPMSLADACLVRMAEKAEGASVITLDSDFRIYRVRGRQVIPTIMPPHV
jgi:predicted nucleic acid-binding protein